MGSRRARWWILDRVTGIVRLAAGFRCLSRSAHVMIALGVSVLVVGACAAGESASREPRLADEVADAAAHPPVPTTRAVGGSGSEPLEAVSSTTTRMPAPAADPPSLTVRSVADGDTLVVSDGRRIRLAQVDAPETNECYGSQSTAALTRLAVGTIVLRRPSNGPEKDRYGRTVAEVYAGGVSVNEALVREGAAQWGDGFAGEDADTARRLAAAESEARAARRGLWSGCAAPAGAAPPTEGTGPGTAGGPCEPAYPDDCIPPPPPDLGCPDIGRMVRVDHRHGDPHRFDVDKDGWGCESYR